MTAPPPFQPNNPRAILWMVLGMLGFAIGDAFLKLLAGSIPPGQALMYMGLGGGIIFALMATAAKARNWRANARDPIVMVRTLCEALAATGFVLAFRTADLSLVAAIIQANPLLVTLGAALWLGEPVGLHRWTAIAVGLIGVIIVIQPWGASFDPGALWAVFGVAFLSARDLLTRRVPAHISTAQLRVYAMIALMPAGLVVDVLTGAQFEQPTSIEWIFLAGLTLMIPVGFFGTTMAMRLGEASVVSPYRYTRLIFALLLAALIFNERPDVVTLLGAGLVVLSGLYAFWRQSKAAKRA